MRDLFRAVKKVLIVSPHFPPLNAPDMQRVRMSLPYFAAEGWEPVVLALGVLGAWSARTGGYRHLERPGTDGPHRRGGEPPPQPGCVFRHHQVGQAPADQSSWVAVQYPDSCRARVPDGRVGVENEDETEAPPRLPPRIAAAYGG